MEWLQGDKGLAIETVYGGTDLERQAKKLDAGGHNRRDPGRVIDMTKRGHLGFQTSNILRMRQIDVDMGFFPTLHG